MSKSQLMIKGTERLGLMVCVSLSTKVCLRMAIFVHAVSEIKTD